MPKAGRGGGHTLAYVVETGEGGGPPSHLTVLKLASLALPVSPTPNGDIPTVQCTGFLSASAISFTGGTAP